MNEDQQAYWNSFNIISDEYRAQVIALSADMHNRQWSADIITLPLHRPLKFTASTDVVPAPFRPLPSITLRRIDDVTWIPVGDVENK